MPRYSIVLSAFMPLVCSGWQTSSLSKLCTRRTRCVALLFSSEPKPSLDRWCNAIASLPPSTEVKVHPMAPRPSDAVNLLLARDGFCDEFAPIDTFFGNGTLGSKMATSLKERPKDNEIRALTMANRGLKPRCVSNLILSELLDDLLPEDAPFVKKLALETRTQATNEDELKRVTDAVQVVEAALHVVKQFDDGASTDLASWLAYKACNPIGVRRELELENPKGKWLELFGPRRTEFVMERLPGFEDHAPRFRVVAKFLTYMDMGPWTLSEGEGWTRKEAEQQAAAALYSDLVVYMWKCRVLGHDSSCRFKE